MTNESNKFSKVKLTISEHIKELSISSTVRNYRTVQKEGNREVNNDELVFI